VKEDFMHAERCLDLLANEEMWTLARDEDNIVTYCQDSATEFLVRGEAVIRTSIFVLLALFSENDLLPNMYDLMQNP
jgi:hypothetical protein